MWMRDFANLSRGSYCAIPQVAHEHLPEPFLSLRCPSLSWGVTSRTSSFHSELLRVNSVVIGQ